MICPTCNKELNKLVVKKPGVNQGREFYMCKDSKHNFFKWVSNPNKETPINLVPNEVWEKKDRWQAKMSAWKSAASVYEGMGEETRVIKLAKLIYESITKEDMEGEAPFTENTQFTKKEIDDFDF